mgnify:CR=1 FL=1
MINRLELKNGINVLSTGLLGRMHIHVKDGQPHSATIFNARVKKNTNSVQQNNKRLHYVNLEIQIDE